jgi:hypothetical protein
MLFQVEDRRGVGLVAQPLHLQADRRHPGADVEGEFSESVRVDPLKDAPVVSGERHLRVSERAFGGVVDDAADEAHLAGGGHRKQDGQENRCNEPRAHFEVTTESLKGF